MDVHSLFRVADGRVRIRLAGERLQYGLQRWSGVVVKPVTG
jgi:hypothetical protein